MQVYTMMSLYNKFCKSEDIEMKILKVLTCCMILVLNTQPIYAIGHTNIELDGPTEVKQEPVDTDDLSLKTLEGYSLLLVGSSILGAIGFSLKERNQKHE